MITKETYRTIFKKHLNENDYNLLCEYIDDTHTDFFNLKEGANCIDAFNCCIPLKEIQNKNEKEYLRLVKVFQNIELEIDEENQKVNTVENKPTVLEEVGMVDVYHYNTKDYYKGKQSLYNFAKEWDLNAWEFDIVKRVVRCRHKGEFEQDLNKTKDVIDIYLKEHK